MSSSSSSQQSLLRKELEVWKERYFVERKCRKLVENWTLHAFGFDVKTEYEKSSNTIRIQGIENKEAMKSAAVPNESIDSEMRVVVMEGKLSPDDFLDESDDDIMAEMSNNSNEVDQHQQQGMISNLDGVVSRIISGDATSNNVSFVPGETTEMKGESEVLLTGHQQFHQQQQSQQFEIATATSTGSDSNSQEVYYIGNYDEMGGGQPQYFILKSGENEDIPVQLDYSSIFGSSGTGIESNPPLDKQVYFRIVGPGETSSSGSAITSESVAVQIQPNTTIVSPAKIVSPQKRKAPVGQKASDNVKHATPKAKKKASPSPSKLLTRLPEVENDPSARMKGNIPVTVKPQVSKSPAPTNAGKQNEEKSQNSIEFGLTLREKAEIYVRTKASEALRKVGNGYECILCWPEVKYVYNSFENALTHTKSHFDSKPYKCEFCSETFAVQREVLQHRKTVHPKVKPSSSTSYGVSKPIPVTLSQSKYQKFTVSTSQVKSLTLSNSNTKAISGKLSSSKSVASILPTTKDKIKQFKCKMSGCEWSYATPEELGWHMKAHQQNRI